MNKFKVGKINQKTIKDINILLQMEQDLLFELELLRHESEMSEEYEEQIINELNYITTIINNNLWGDS